MAKKSIGTKCTLYVAWLGRNKSSSTLEARRYYKVKEMGVIEITLDMDQNAEEPDKMNT